MGSDKRSTASLEHLYLFYNWSSLWRQSCLFGIVKYQSHVIMKYILILVILCGNFNPSYFDADGSSRSVSSLHKNYYISFVSKLFPKEFLKVLFVSHYSSISIDAFQYQFDNLF